MRRACRVTIAIVALVGFSAVPSAATEPPAAGALSSGDLGAHTLERGDAYYHVLKARLAAGRGRISETVRDLAEALRLDPGSADLHAEAAGLLASLGRREEAERLARKALDLDPGQSSARRTLADLLATRVHSPDSSAREEAIGHYERLAQEPGSDVLPILTSLKVLANDLPGALEVARRFAAQHPSDPAATKLLTQLLLQQGRPEEAVSALVGFLASNPDSEELLASLSDLVGRTGQWEEVAAACARILEKAPEARGVRGLMAEAWLRLGRVEEAKLELERALEPPGGAAAESRLRGLLGEALLRAGSHEEAVMQLERALELAPSEPLFRLHLASAYGYVGRLADASGIARAMAGDYPGNPGVLVILGEILSQQGLVEGASDAFTAALRALDGPDAPTAERRDDLRLRLASLHLGRKRVDDAIRFLRTLESPDRTVALQFGAKAAILSGDYRTARQKIRRLNGRKTRDRGIAALLEAEALLREGREAKAEAKFEQAIAVLGPGAREQVGAIYKETGHLSRAEAVLAEWVRVEPDNPEAHFTLGRFYERTDRFPQAEAALRAVLELDPEHGQGLNYLGYSLADRNERLEEALSLIQRALAVDRWNGAFLDSLGWVYFRMGEYQKAREPLERASREYPQDPTVLEHLGDVYDRLGDRERAESAWRRALEAGAEDPEALRSKISGERGRSRTEPAPSGRQRVRSHEPAPGEPPAPR